MAMFIMPKSGIQRRRFKLVTISAAAALAAFPALSQTVVIGGSGAAPVQVNIPTFQATGIPNPYSQPTMTTPQGQQDFSKSSKIVFGNEVINLVPPGSRPKKKRIVADRKKAPAVKKPAVAEKTAVVKETIPVVKETAPAVKAAPAPKVEVTRLAPVKKKVPEAVAPVTSESKTVEAPKSMTEKPAPVVAKQEESAPKQTTVAPTVQPEKPAPSSAPRIEDVATAPSTPLVMTPSKPEPVTSSAPEEKMQVAALAPKEIKEPVAAAPMAPQSADKGNQIFFEPEQTKLPASAKDQLKTLANTLKSGDGRIQLVAFADAGSNSAARRLSLGRALIVRSKLMEFGVPNNRIEVRALGKPTDSSPADRVDLKLITR